MRQQQRGGTILGFILGVAGGLGRSLCRGGVRQQNSGAVSHHGWDKAAPPRMPQADWIRIPPWAARSRLHRSRPWRSSPKGVAPTETPAAQAAASNDPFQGPWPRPKLPRPKKPKRLKKPKRPASDGFVYFVQVGAFRSQADADAQRAKLGLIGQQARVSEREQNGRPVYRVRIGPMAQRSEAEALKQQLASTGIDAALVRIHQ